MKYIILNADDFGFGQPCNRAIAKLLEFGILGSTSVMSNMPGAEAAVRSALGSLMVPDFGLHVCLNERFLVTPGLVSLRLNERSLNDQVALLDQCSHHSLLSEMSAQLELLRVFGADPSHLNVHYHLHLFVPAVTRALIELGNKAQLPIRWFTDEATQEMSSYLKYLNVSDVERRIDLANRLVEDSRVQTIPSETSFYERDASFETLLRIVTNAPEGKVLEITCHPADGAMEGDSYSDFRAQEYQLLKSTPVKELIACPGVTWGSFRSSRRFIDNGTKS